MKDEKAKKIKLTIEVGVTKDFPMCMHQEMMTLKQKGKPVGRVLTEIAGRATFIQFQEKGQNTRCFTVELRSILDAIQALDVKEMFGDLPKKKGARR